MPEHRQRNAADSALRDADEHHVAQFREQRSEVALRRFQHLREAVLHGDRQPHALDVDVGHAETGARGNKAPLHLLAPAAASDRRLDDGEFALLAGRNDVELGPAEILHVIGEQRCGIIVDEIVEFGALPRRKFLHIGAQSIVSDALEVDVAVEQRRKLRL